VFWKLPTVMKVPNKCKTWSAENELIKYEITHSCKLLQMWTAELARDLNEHFWSLLSSNWLNSFGFMDENYFLMCILVLWNG